jgi:superfamily I DNA/RNA helicase
VTAPTKHHASAAAANAAVATEAAGVLRDVLSGESAYMRILLKAAAGAGKSYVLRQLVAAAVDHRNCDRVAVVAFTNKQTWPLAAELGKLLGRDRVCLFPSAAMAGSVPQEVWDNASVASSTASIPSEAKVIVSTVHKLGAIGELKRQSTRFGAGRNG